ncbi:MAG: hypothetical protein K0R18_2253 [Bacillales bacterium]|jgi:hypothetical protein|nr:hypothetical protein [Bacillales bacterium]
MGQFSAIPIMGFYGRIPDSRWGWNVMKKILVIVCLILVIFYISGLHFTETNAIPGDVKKIDSLVIGGYGKAVLFEDETYNSFGVARIEKRFGFFYRYRGSTSDYSVEDGKPFTASGFGSSEHKSGNSFLVAVETTKNSNIKYIAIGNHMGGITPSDTYELTLRNVKDNKKDYHLKEVKDNYVLFVLDKYTEDNWTIRAFDKDGNLIADQLFGTGVARYINWETKEEIQTTKSVREIAWNSLVDSERSEVVGDWEDATVSKVTSNTIRFSLIDTSFNGKEVSMVTFHSTKSAKLGDITKLVDEKSQKVIGSGFRN